MKQYGIDPLIFLSALLIVLLVCIPIMYAPEQSGMQIEALYSVISSNFGLFYQWTVIGIVTFLGWIAFGRYGKIKLGDPDESPEYSTFSWVSMLFCAGVGAGLVYWLGYIVWPVSLGAYCLGHLCVAHSRNRLCVLY